MSRSEDRTAEGPTGNTEQSQVANHASKCVRPGLSRPLIELIAMPSDEQIRTLARIFGLFEGGPLYESIKARLERESADRKPAGESAA